MTTSSERQPRSVDALESKIKGIGLSRERLERALNQLGTGEYEGQGGSRLDLGALSGEARIDAALKVGTAKKRINESILPRLETIERETRINLLNLNVKIAQVRVLIQQGYLQETVLEDVVPPTGQKTFSETSSPQPVAPARPVAEPEKVSPIPAAQTMNQEPVSLEAGSPEELGSTSNIILDESGGRIRIDERDIRFNTPDRNATFKLLVHLLRNSERTVTHQELKEYIASLNSDTPVESMIFRIKGKIELSPGDPKILITTSRGRQGSLYGIHANSVSFVDQMPSLAKSPERQVIQLEVEQESIPQSPQRSEATEGEDLPNIEIAQMDNKISIDGRVVAFNPRDKFSLPLLLHMSSGKEMDGPELDAVLKRLGSTSRIVQAMYVLKQRVEADPSHPRVFNPKGPGGRGSKATYKMRGNIRIVDHLTTPEATAPDAVLAGDVDLSRLAGALREAMGSSGSREEGSDEATRTNGDNDGFAFLQAQLVEPSAYVNGTQAGEIRMAEVDAIHQRELKLNLGLTVLSYLTINDPDNQITTDPVSIINERANSYREGYRGIRYDEMLKKLTGASSNTELRKFFLDSFMEVLKEFWEKGPAESETSGTSEQRIAEYCKTLREEAKSDDRSITMPGVQMEEVVREVCRHFKLDVPEEYKGEYFNPRIKLYSDNPIDTGKQRRRQPSHGKQRL